MVPVTAPCQIYPVSLLAGGTIWGTSQSCPGGPAKAVLISQDYGATWKVIDLGDMRVSSIVGASQGEAWLTDELGKFYITADGGSSWTQVAPALR